MGPKISVIVPNYNHEGYLRRRLDTILAQSFQDFELIILDDRSTDNSVSVLLEYKNKPCVSHFIVNERNSGSPFKQWKLGLSLARGEWIWIAESDDYSDPNFLADLLLAAESSHNIGLAYCDSYIVDEGGCAEKTIGDIKNERYGVNRWRSNYTNSGLNEIQDFLLGGGTINNTSAVLFRRSILLEADAFDIDFRYVGDKYAFVKVLALSNVVYVSTPRNYYWNPFNTKHASKEVDYFYEQFLIFNWVYRNLELDVKKFYGGFFLNTRLSVFQNWTFAKMKIYGKLFLLSPKLTLKNVWFNISQGLNSLFRRFEIILKS